MGRSAPCFDNAVTFARATAAQRCQRAQSDRAASAQQHPHVRVRRCPSCSPAAEARPASSQPYPMNVEGPGPGLLVFPGAGVGVHCVAISCCSSRRRPGPRGWRLGWHGELPHVLRVCIACPLTLHRLCTASALRRSCAVSLPRADGSRGWCVRFQQRPQRRRCRLSAQRRAWQWQEALYGVTRSVRYPADSIGRRSTS